MLANFAQFSRTLATELPKLTAQMQKTLSQVEGVVAENRGDLRGTMENVKQATANIQTSIDNLNAISTQIKSGEGTIGKLIYDSEAHDTLVSTLKSVEGGVTSLSGTLGRMQKIELQLAHGSGQLPRRRRLRRRHRPAALVEQPESVLPLRRQPAIPAAS